MTSEASISGVRYLILPPKDLSDAVAGEAGAITNYEGLMAAKKTEVAPLASYMYIYIYTHMYYTYKYTYIYTDIYTYVYIYIYTYIHIYLHTYTYMHIYSYIYIYVYIHILLPSGVSAGSGMPHLQRKGKGKAVQGDSLV